MSKKQIDDEAIFLWIEKDLNDLLAHHLMRLIGEEPEYYFVRSLGRVMFEAFKAKYNESMEKE